MRWHIKPAATLAAAMAFGALALSASPALAATTAASSRPSAPAAAPAPVVSVALVPVGNVPAAVNPQCVLHIANAHISTFLFKKHNIRAVKVNSQIKCRRVSMHLFLQTTLWKTGLIIPHKVAGPTTKTAAKGNLIKNQKTWKQCKNRKSSTYYGTAFGRVVFQGHTYTASAQSPKKVPLACGT